MWTPPLRESWSFPWLPLQIYFVLKILNNDLTNKTFIKTVVVSSLFMISWQFAQFALLTQICCILITFLLDLTSHAQFDKYLIAMLTTLLLNFILQFGNDMLLTSFIFSCILVGFVISQAVKYIENFKVVKKYKILKVVLFVPLWFLGTYSCKALIAKTLSVTDDAHIFDILKSKLVTDFDTFHTKLYTCAKEFDFIELETFIKLSKTGLLPIVLIVFATVGIRSFIHSAGYASTITSTHCYLGLQTLAFTILAIFIMRLKLFMTPTFCILASLAVKKEFFHEKLKPRIWTFLLLTAGFFFAGGSNIKNELNRIGSFENYPHEQMLEFINEKMPNNVVFAGAMPTMASIKHITGRAVVNHPHYENEEIRNRTEKVYSMWYRKPMADIHKILKELQVTHFIYEHSWCTRSNGPGCSMAELFDHKDVENRGKRPVCLNLKQEINGYFNIVYENGIYKILELK